MAKDKPNTNAPSHKFLEYKKSVEDMAELLPYMLDIWEMDAESMRARYEALVDKGFTPSDALEIIKARGAQI